jgi:glycosyltransferase involved in cell wall biosynthesis
MITPDYPPSFGGIGAHVYSLTKELERLGCNIVLLICRMRRPTDTNISFELDRPIKQCRIGNIEIIDFNTCIQTDLDDICKDYDFFTSESYHDFRTIWNCYDLTSRILKFFIGRKQKFDLIHLHDAFSGPSANLLKEIYNVPLITTIHGVNANEITIIDNLKRYIIFNSNVIIAVSESTKRQIIIVFI